MLAIESACLSICRHRPGHSSKLACHSHHKNVNSVTSSFRSISDFALLVLGRLGFLLLGICCMSLPTRLLWRGRKIGPAFFRSRQAVSYGQMSAECCGLWPLLFVATILKGACCWVPTVVSFQVICVCAARRIQLWVIRAVIFRAFPRLPIMNRCYVGEHVPLFHEHGSTICVCTLN